MPLEVPEPTLEEAKEAVKQVIGKYAHIRNRKELVQKVFKEIPHIKRPLLALAILSLKRTPFL